MWMVLCSFVTQSWPLTGEVDEHAEHGEHAVVLGPRGAERERIGLRPGIGSYFL